MSSTSVDDEAAFERLEKAVAENDYVKASDVLSHNERIRHDHRCAALLLQAVDHNSLGLVGLLLDKCHPDPNTQDGLPLVRAIERRYNQVVERLLRHRAIEPAICNNRPLAIAIQHENLTAVDYLLRYPQVVSKIVLSNVVERLRNSENDRIINLVHEAYLKHIAQENDAERALDLTKQFARMIPMPANLQRQLLKLAAEHGRVELVRYLLVHSHGQLIDIDIFNALQAAAMWDRANVVGMLITEFSVNAQDVLFDAILHAAQKGYTGVLRTVLESAPDFDPSVSGDAAFIAAAQHGQLTCLNILLGNENVGRRVVGSAAEAFYRAVAHDHVNVVRVLMARKDLDIRIGYDDNRLITTAVERRNTTMVLELLRDPRVDASVAFREAMLRSCTDMARAVFRARADTIDAAGLIPVAIAGGADDIVRGLLARTTPTAGDLDFYIAKAIGEQNLDLLEIFVTHPNFSRRNVESHTYALQTAVGVANKSAIRFLLAHTDANPRGNNDALLRDAAAARDYTLIKLLVAHHSYMGVGGAAAPVTPPIEVPVLVFDQILNTYGTDEIRVLTSAMEAVSEVQAPVPNDPANEQSLAYWPLVYRSLEHVLHEETALRVRIWKAHMRRIFSINPVDEFRVALGVGDVESVRNALLRARGRIRLSERVRDIRDSSGNRRSEYPIVYAIQFASADMVRELMYHGGDVWGEGPTVYAEALAVAVSTNNVELFEILLAIDIIVGMNGGAVERNAVQNPDTTMLEMLLRDDRFFASAERVSKALDYAIEKKNAQAVRLLFDAKGEMVDVHDRRMRLAVNAGSVEIVDVIWLRCNWDAVDVNALVLDSLYNQDTSMFQYLMSHDQFHKKDTIETAWCEAARNRNIDAMHMLHSDGRTRVEDSTLVRLVVEGGLDIDNFEYVLENFIADDAKLDESTIVSAMDFSSFDNMCRLLDDPRQQLSTHEPLRKAVQKMRARNFYDYLIRLIGDRRTTVDHIFLAMDVLEALRFLVFPLRYTNIPDESQLDNFSKFIQDPRVDMSDFGLVIHLIRFIKKHRNFPALEILLENPRFNPSIENFSPLQALILGDPDESRLLASAFAHKRIVAAVDAPGANLNDLVKEMVEWVQRRIRKAKSDEDVVVHVPYILYRQVVDTCLHQNRCKKRDVDVFLRPLPGGDVGSGSDMRDEDEGEPDLKRTRTKARASSDDDDDDDPDAIMDELLLLRAAAAAPETQVAEFVRDPRRRPFRRPFDWEGIDAYLSGPSLRQRVRSLLPDDDGGNINVAAAAALLQYATTATHQSATPKLWDIVRQELLPMRDRLLRLDRRTARNAIRLCTVTTAAHADEHSRMWIRSILDAFCDDVDFVVDSMFSAVDLVAKHTKDPRKLIATTMRRALPQHRCAKRLAAACQ